MPAMQGWNVKAEGGFILWKDGGEINNCEIGIGNLAPDSVDGAPINIYMNHFTTIRNCHSGVVMKGDAATGLAMMDCARILEIGKSGIHGEDITLLIGPLLINIRSTCVGRGGNLIQTQTTGFHYVRRYFSKTP